MSVLVSGKGPDGSEVPLKVGATGALDSTATVALTNVTTATLSNVAASATNVTVLAANTSRKRIIIHNDSTAKVRLKFGATATTTSFTLALNAYETYETPTNIIYTGIIDGIWESATGSARVTEMV